MYIHLFRAKFLFFEVKTGGESLELHLAPQPAPRLDYSTCRRAALRFQDAAAGALLNG